MADRIVVGRILVALWLAGLGLDGQFYQRSSLCVRVDTVGLKAGT